MKIDAWISVKDRLPDNNETVLTRLNKKDDQFLVCRFYENLSTLEGDFKNIFVLSLWSKFPKWYALSETFYEHFSFKKNQITHWRKIE